MSAWVSLLGAERTEKENADRRANVAGEFDIKEFSCDRCSASRTCDYAFDPYNTNGDCLAEK